MARFNKSTGALRPIIRETYEADRYAANTLAVHEGLGIRQVGQVPSGPRVSAPVISGIRLKSPGRVNGASFAPQRNNKFI